MQQIGDECFLWYVPISICSFSSVHVVWKWFGNFLPNHFVANPAFILYILDAFEHDGLNHVCPYPYVIPNPSFFVATRQTTDSITWQRTVGSVGIITYYKHPLLPPSITCITDRNSTSIIRLLPLAYRHEHLHQDCQPDRYRRHHHLPCHCHTGNAGHCHTCSPASAPYLAG